MAVLDHVVRRLRAARVAGQTAHPAQGGEVVLPPGDDLVHVRLVPGVPDDRVARGVEDAVQGQGELDGTQVGAEMAMARGLDGVDDQRAELLGQLVQLRLGERPEIGRTGDRIEEHG